MARRRTTVYAAAIAKSAAAVSWLSFCSPQQLARPAVHIGLSPHMPRRRQHLPQQSPAPTRLCSLALVDRRNRWAVAVLQYAVALQPPPSPPQVYGTEFVLGASADEVVGCRELYRRRLAASADRLLFRRRRIAGLDRRAVPSQLFPRATAFLNTSCSLG